MSNNSSIVDSFMEENTLLDTVMTVSYSVVVFFIMLAMGSTVRIGDLTEHIRRPIGAIIGLVAQIFLLPALTYALALVFKVDNLIAVGMIVLGSAPGGTMSNLFTLWMEGDLSLSICMTCISTMVAVGTMPMNLYMYSSRLPTEGFSIPFDTVAISLITVLVPVCIGLLVRWKKPRVALIISRLGSLSGASVVLSAIVVQTIRDPEAYRMTRELWVIAGTYPLIGFSTGFMISFLLYQSRSRCIAIAFELGSQNVALSIALISTFGMPQSATMNLFPTLYSFIMTLEYSAIVLIYRITLKVVRESTGSTNSEQKPPLSSSRDLSCCIRVKIWLCGLDWDEESKVINKTSKIGKDNPAFTPEGSEQRTASDDKVKDTERAERRENGSTEEPLMKLCFSRCCSFRQKHYTLHQ